MSSLKFQKWFPTACRIKASLLRMVCKILHNQSHTFVLAWSFLTPLCMSPQALVILNCLKFTLCDRCFVLLWLCKYLLPWMLLPLPSSYWRNLLLIISVFSVRFICSAMLLLTDSPFCGAHSHPHIPTPDPWSGSWTVSTCSMHLSHDSRATILSCSFLNTTDTK